MREAIFLLHRGTRAAFPAKPVQNFMKRPEAKGNPKAVRGWAACLRSRKTVEAEFS
jgi:hypothetical protein